MSTEDKKTLTPQILALYLGCEVFVPETNRNAILTGIMWHKGLTTILDVQYGDEDYDVFNENDEIDRVKPILRPLSSMTEDEKHEYNIRKQRKGFMAQVHADNTVWLLSKGFDLFGLIDSGLAITQPK